MARPKGSKNVKWNKDELQRLYWEEGLSSVSIGKLLKVPHQAVRQAMRRFKINFRSKSEAISGERHYAWRGDNLRFTDVNGYVFVRALEGHPYADKHGYIREHKLIMEKKLGYYLPPKTIVHHLNGIYDDNREENLIVFDRKTHDNLIPAFQKRIRQLENALKERNRQQVLL